MPTQALNPPDAQTLCIHRLTPRSPEPIRITSPAFAPRGTIPLQHSAYGEGVSPSLSFANVPTDAVSLVLLLEDPDAVSRKPFIHWVLVNLPPKTPYLRGGLPTTDTLPDLGDARQGENSTGKTGYFGMKPPVGHEPHHYHFSLFALDVVLHFEPGQKIEHDAVVKQMHGHVLASGDLIGRYGPPKEQQRESPNPS